MKFRCDKESLLHAIDVVSKKESANKSTGTYFKTSNSSLDIKSSSFTMSISSSVKNVEIEEPGEMFIPPTGIYEVVKRLPNGDVAVEYNQSESLVTFSAGKATFTLHTIKPDSFTSLDVKNVDYALTLSGEDFLGMCRKVAFACSTDPGRPVFTGCSLSVDKGKVTLVGTNTHRLAVKSCCWTSLDGDKASPIIIPAPSLFEAVRTMDAEDNIRIAVGDNRVMIASDSASITSALIAGVFPDYKKIMPQSCPITVRVGTNEFRNTLDRVWLIAKSNDYTLMRLIVDNNQMQVAASNSVIGNINDTLTVEHTGDPIEICFNLRYIHDLLKATELEEITIGMSGPLATTEITDSDLEYKYLVTPVRARG